MRWCLFHFNLFRYDLQAQFVRQGCCCRLGWKLITFNFDGIKDEISRDAHGYPEYYKRLEMQKWTLMKFNLEQIYEDSLDEDYHWVSPIYS